MSTLICPHCGEAILLGDDDDTHTAVSVLNDDQQLTAYHPNPAKRYKTTEKARKAGLDYYYKHRDRRLVEMKEYRRTTKL